MITWGIVSTIKASVPETLRFVAYHLSKGALQICIYLDDANDDAFAILKDHPRVTVRKTDDDWWAKRGRRPVKHQVRQTRNATHCYRRLARVDWLIHMDVDEFLVSDASIGTVLASLPAENICARIRPMEQLAGDPSLFKALTPASAERHRLVEKMYPVFGRYLKTGFLSHRAGKIFVRTGKDDLKLRIHNAMLGDVRIKNEVELAEIDLAHAHAKSWEQFLASYRFRMEQGSYRSDLAPERTRHDGGATLHELFQRLEADGGEHSLRAFFDEVCAATPRLTAALRDHGLLKHADLQLETRVREHFPNNA